MKVLLQVDIPIYAILRHKTALTGAPFCTLTGKNHGVATQQKRQGLTSYRKSTVSLFYYTLHHTTHKYLIINRFISSNTLYDTTPTLHPYSPFSGISSR